MQTPQLQNTPKATVFPSTSVLDEKSLKPVLGSVPEK
jgi:hypothetical protein